MSTQMTAIDSNELFIGGEWVKPQGSGRIEVISASTEEILDWMNEGLRKQNLAFPQANGPILWPQFPLRGLLQSLARPNA